MMRRKERAMMGKSNREQINYLFRGHQGLELVRFAIQTTERAYLLLVFPRDLDVVVVRFCCCIWRHSGHYLFIRGGQKKMTRRHLMTFFLRGLELETKFLSLLLHF